LGRLVPLFKLPKRFLDDLGILQDVFADDLFDLAAIDCLSERWRGR
jgi:hypothetical protein